VKEDAARLRDALMSAHEADAKRVLFDSCEAALGAARSLAFFVPGRIEVFGKHTDYAGGRSLLCAMERGFAVVASPRSDDRVRVVDAMRSEAREVAMDPAFDARRGDWSNYVATVARTMARHFPGARRGAVIAFASDLPSASGMSSSTALMIAMFMVLRAVNELENDPVYRQAIQSREMLAEYLGAVENGRSFGPFAGDRGVGTLGGSQDQTAILCCRAGMLSRYAWCPARAEGEIVLSPDVVFVVAYSGVSAEKTSRALELYNAVSLAAVKIVELWNESTGRADRTLADAVASSPHATSQMRVLLSGESGSERLRDRFEHFLSETYEIIPRAADAIERGDVATFGAEAARSQAGAEKLLGNQIDETVALVRLARAHGALAASAFGAGFGGSVWALARAPRAAHFLDEWRDSYRSAYPEAAAHAAFFITAAGPGALQL
jgi:galactokinase